MVHQLVGIKPGVIPVKVAAERLGVSVSHYLRRVREKRFPGYKPADLGRVVVPEEEFEALLVKNFPHLARGRA